MQLSLEAEQTRQDTKVLNLGITNLLTKFIETLHESLDMKLPGGGGNNPHSTQRYKTAAANLKSLKPEKFTTATRGLSIKYLGIIVNQYSKIVDDRNIEAHESEKVLARLLVTPRMKECPHGHCAMWSPLFPFCYNKTVEELAEEPPTPNLLDSLCT